MDLAIFLLSITSTLLIALLALYSYTRPKTNILGPTEGWTWPILGDALHFAGLWNAEGHLKKVQHLSRMRDKAISVRIGPKLMICVRDADIMEKLLSRNKCINKDLDFYKPFTDYAKGLFSMNGKDWAELRRPLDKIMHPKNFDSFHDIFNQKITQLCDIFEGYCDKGEVDIKEDVSHCALDIVIEAVMGVPSTQLLMNTLHFPAFVDQGTVLIWRRITKPHYKFDWLYRLSSDYQEYKRSVAAARIMSRYIQDMRKNDHAKDGIYPGDTDFKPAKYADVVMHILTQRKWRQDDLDLGLLDVVFAGFDTSSVAMATALLYLAMHPEYQRKAFEEQIRIMGKNLGPPTPNEISQMDYLRMVINETVRHTCPPTFVRTLAEEIVIDGKVFPKGACLVFLVMEMCRDPKYWTNPTEFYPDHFLPEAVAARPKSAFSTFGSGLRGCPGKKFAIDSSLVVLSTILRKFTLATSLKFKEITYKLQIMLECKEGYPFTLTRRAETS